MYSIGIEIKLTDNGMFGFLDTAMQAIAYWDENGRMTFDKRRLHKDGEQIPWLVGGELKYEDPSGEDLLTQFIDHRWIARAIEDALDPEFKVADSTRATIYDCVARDAVGEMDCDAVDAVMQAGLFGELVYG